MAHGSLTIILALALPKMFLNCYLCFTCSWLPTPFQSHSEMGCAHSHWFYLSVKSRIVLKLMRGFVKIVPPWRTVALSSRTNKRTSQMVYKVFQVSPNMFSSNFKFPVYSK